jgi:hypothetical protein
LNHHAPPAINAVVTDMTHADVPSETGCWNELRRQTLASVRRAETIKGAHRVRSCLTKNDMLCLLVRTAAPFRRRG